MRLPDRLLRGLLAAPLAALLVMTGSSVAWAEAGPREVLIGVARIGQQAVAAEEPDRLYHAAADLLRHGARVAGQRQLEQLVARFPDSEAAARARLDLAQLYGAAKPLTVAIGREPMSHLGAPETAVSPTIGAWRTTVRPVTGPQRTAQQQLRDAAGDLVFFSEGSAELGSRARKALAAQAEWLRRSGDRDVVVEGHADEPGTPDELKALAAARAEAVRGRLIEEGVAAERLRIVVYGNERRIALCSEPGCASQNRRVVTTVGGPPVAEAAARGGERFAP